MKALLAALALTALAGCAAAPVAPPAARLVALPSGDRGLEVRCSGAHRSFADCMNAAAASCNGAYRVLSQDASSPMAVAVPVGNLTAVVPVQRRAMIVQCGA